MSYVKWVALVGPNLCKPNVFSELQKPVQRRPAESANAGGVSVAEILWV